jgi:hypothetical protein
MDRISRCLFKQWKCGIKLFRDHGDRVASMIELIRQRIDMPLNTTYVGREKSSQK